MNMPISIGLEGSANKLGVGIILHPPHHTSDPPSPHDSAYSDDEATLSRSRKHTSPPVQILANLRHTYNSPPGTGMLLVICPTFPDIC